MYLLRCLPYLLGTYLGTTHEVRPAALPRLKLLLVLGSKVVLAPLPERSPPPPNFLPPNFDCQTSPGANNHTPKSTQRSCQALLQSLDDSYDTAYHPLAAAHRDQEQWRTSR